MAGVEVAVGGLDGGDATGELRKSARGVGKGAGITAIAAGSMEGPGVLGIAPMTPTFPKSSFSLMNLSGAT